MQRQLQLQASIWFKNDLSPITITEMNLNALQKKIMETLPEHELPKTDSIMVIMYGDSCIETDQHVCNAFRREEDPIFSISFEPNPPSRVSDLQVVELWPNECVLTWNHLKDANRCMYFVMNDKDVCLCKTSYNIARIGNLKSESEYTFYVMAVYCNAQERQQHVLSSSSSSIDTFKRRCSRSPNLIIKTPSINLSTQAFINSHVAVDQKTIKCEPSNNNQIAVTWKPPSEFCGKISYELYHKEKYIGQVFQLPCILQVNEFVGKGKLSLSVQVVLATKYGNVTNVNLPISDSKEPDLIKPDTMQLLVEYRSYKGANQMIEISADMKYDAFFSRILRPLYQQWGSCIDKERDLLEVAMSCSSAIFDGNKYFVVKDNDLWKQFWCNYASKFFAAEKIKCLVYMKPQICSVTCTNGMAKILFTTEAPISEYQIEGKLIFDSGEEISTLFPCRTSPAFFPLGNSQKVMDALKRPNSTICLFRIRSVSKDDSIPWSGFSAWSEVAVT